MADVQGAMEFDPPLEYGNVSGNEEDFESFDEEDEEESAESEGSIDDDMSEDSMEKSDTEQELEGLVFGDTAGFRQNIKAWRADQSEEQRQQDSAISGVDDSDLFFLDAGPDQSLAPPPEDQDRAPSGRGPPAWEDSDDDRMLVSLMSVPRLKKLRRYDGEDVISGREYQRRLRQHFELLNPRPKWAQYATAQKSRKRRRTSSAVDGSDSDDSDDDLSMQPLAKLMRTSTPLTRGPQHTSTQRPKLRPDVIAIERMKDIAPTQPSAITSISIHPALPLLLTTGPASTVYLHHLLPHPTPPDPANPLITSLHLKSTSLTTAAFSPPPSTTPSSTKTKAQPQEEMPKIYLSSRRRYFHTWDLTPGSIKKTTRIHGHASSQKSMEVLKPSPCGRYIALLGSTRKNGGVVNILDANTTFWIAEAAIESGKGVADFAWWGDGGGMAVVGRGGEVGEYSMSERRIVGRWRDEGAVGVTTVAMGGSDAGYGEGGNGKNGTRRRNERGGVDIGPDRYIAVGSTSGIVNIYTRSSLSSAIDSAPGTTSYPTPHKTLPHLTTPISTLAISPCGQLLAMASKWKKDALRLVHLGSGGVYRNWPTSKTPLGRVSGVGLGEYEIGAPGGGREGGDAGGDGGGGKGRKGEEKIVLIVGNEAGVLRGWEIGG